MNAAVIIYLLLLLSGAACLSVGIYILLGLGWMLIVLALALFGFAVFLQRGLIDENISTNSE